MINLKSLQVFKNVQFDIKKYFKRKRSYKFISLIFCSFKSLLLTGVKNFVVSSYGKRWSEETSFLKELSSAIICHGKVGGRQIFCHRRFHGRFLFLAVSTSMSIYSHRKIKLVTFRAMLSYPTSKDDFENSPLPFENRISCCKL